MDASWSRTRGTLMAAEIAEQPRALQRLLDRQLPEINKVAAAIRQAGPRFVLTDARGTSDNAALYFKYLAEINLRLPSGSSSPSTMTTYRAVPDLKDVLWVTISQSGGSPDLIETTTMARAAGALTLAVTNAPRSPLAQVAELNIDIEAGVESAVAATKSYTCQLLALYLLVDALMEGDGSAAFVLPGLAESVLSSAVALQFAPRYRFVDRLVTTGRAFSYPTALEAALKLMETLYLSAHGFSSADLMHGPLAMIDEDRPVIAIVPEGPGGEATQPVLDRLADRSADVIIVGDPHRAVGFAGCIPLPSGVPVELSPILEIMPMQQLAHAMSVARGYDPDAPRGLRKITETL